MPGPTRLISSLGSLVSKTLPRYVMVECSGRAVPSAVDAYHVPVMATSCAAARSRTPGYGPSTGGVAAGGESGTRYRRTPRLLFRLVAATQLISQGASHFVMADQL